MAYIKQETPKRPSVISVPVTELEEKPFLHTPNFVDMRPSKRKQFNIETIPLKRKRDDEQQDQYKKLKLEVHDINVVSNNKKTVEYGQIKTETINLNGRKVVCESIERKTAMCEDNNTKVISFISPDPKFSKFATNSLELDMLLQKIIMASQPVPFNAFSEKFNPIIPAPEEVIIAKPLPYITSIDPICFISDEYGFSYDLYRFDTHCKDFSFILKK